MYENWELEELDAATQAAVTSRERAESPADWWAGYIHGTSVGAAQARLGVSHLLATAPTQLGKFAARLASQVPEVRPFESVARAHGEQKNAA